MTLGSIWAEWVSVRANSHPLNSSTKRYWFYLCAICVRALIKTGKPSALISALHSRKALSVKDIAEVSEQISHLLNCAMENNRKRKLQYLFSHVTLGWLLSKIDIGQPHRQIDLDLCYDIKGSVTYIQTFSFRLGFTKREKNWSCKNLSFPNINHKKACGDETQNKEYLVCGAETWR